MGAETLQEGICKETWEGEMAMSLPGSVPEKFPSLSDDRTAEEINRLMGKRVSVITKSI
jgi:hypothetical protein